MGHLSNTWVGGTVSEATLRPQDLIASFCRVLAEADPQEAARLSQEYAAMSPNETARGDEGWLIDELINKLNDAAPDGCYFGTHEGDGALFGFWLIPEEVGEDG